MQNQADPDYCQFGPYRLTRADRTLWRDNQPVPLTDRAFNVLWEIAIRGGEPIATGELLGTVWAGVHVDESNVPTQVGLLRRKLGVDPKGQQYIRTIPGKGYYIPGATLGRTSAPAERRVSTCLRHLEA